MEFSLFPYQKAISYQLRKMNRSTTNHPYLLLFLVIIIWGINHVVARCLSSPVLFGYVHITGVLLAFLRYATGALTLILILYLHEGSLSEIHNQTRPFIGVLAVSILVSSVFVLAANQSQAYISAGTSSIIINICPIPVLIYGIFFSGGGDYDPQSNRVRPWATGWSHVLYNSLKSGGSSHVGWGVLLAIIAMIAWAGYTITLHYLEEANRLAVLSIQLAVSSLLIVPFLGVYSMTSPLEFVFDIWSILGVLFCGIPSSGIAYLLFFRAIEAIGRRKRLLSFF